MYSSRRMKVVKRKSEMWVSNNRVLVGGTKKVTGRNPNFDADETKMLIRIWGDPQVQRTLITTHKKHTVIAKLAEQMKEYGYHRSPEEINTRIKNLKCFYNRLKKDMEIGILSDPSWKHFPAMDEIMNRPIFSVRPNEVPQPSLRYKMEEEMREREERIKNGEVLEDDNILDEESGSDEAKSNDFFPEMDFDDEDDKPLKIKHEQDEEETESVLPCNDDDPILVVPKDEPIDIEDEDVTEINTPKPAPMQFIQISSAMSTATTNMVTSRAPTTISRIMTTIPSNLAQPSLTSPSSKLLNNSGQQLIIANQTKKPGQPGSGGKISLVPTNFLLQPQQTSQNQQQQPQQIQLRAQPQQQTRILYTQPTSQANSGIVSGPGGMKVLLVNTVQNDQNGNPGATKTVDMLSHSNPNAMKNNTIQTNHLQSILNSAVAANNAKNAAAVAAADEAKKSANIMPKELNGLRTLLNHLINLQTDTNEIERKRLELEQQRFEFEKSMADKFFTAFPTFLQSLQGTKSAQTENETPKDTTDTPAAKQTGSLERQQDTDESDEPDFTGFQLITPKIEMEED